MADATSKSASGAPDGPNAATFAREFEAVAPVLLGWARLRVRPELRAMLDPEDLLQEVGCRALAMAHTHDPARASFRQWVFGIANHVLLEALRELGRRPLMRDAGPDRTGFSDAIAAITTITRKVARDELVGRLLTQIEGLDPEDRALLLHHGLEELPYPEVARLLGLQEDAVRKRWQRLRAKLRGDPSFVAFAPCW